MKKKLLLVFVLILSLAMVACGGQKTDEKPEPQKEPDKKVEAPAEKEEPKKDFSIALVTDTGGIDDRSFNQGTWEGVLRFAEKVGAETTYAQSNSDADYIPNLSTFSEDEHDIIVAPGFLFEKSLTEVSANFPDQKYLIIDMVVGDRPNVASAVFAEHEGSFLVGVAAAEKAKEAGKNVVGYIGGGDFGLIQKFEAGYEQGVKAVDPSIKILIDYVGDFSDAGKAQSIANKMYDEGAYVIYHAAGGAGNGLIKEAKDRKANGEDVWAIGVDRDQYEEGIYEGEKSIMLTSMVKRVDVAAHDVCKFAYEGKFPGGEVLVFSLENDGVDIPKENPNLSEEIVKKIYDFKARIVAGEIEVKEVPKRVEK